MLQIYLMNEGMVFTKELECKYKSKILYIITIITKRIFMEIYVVQQGDDINSIAERYGFAVDKLIQDNGLVYPYNLVIGQTLVIALPKQTHIVQQGDTLQSIADSYSITIMQL